MTQASYQKNIGILNLTKLSNAILRELERGNNLKLLNIPLFMGKCFVFLLLLMSHATNGNAQSSQGNVFNFDRNWEFVKDIDSVKARLLVSSSHGPAIAWQKISLPHTAQIEPIKTITKQWQGTCFYRKFFKISKPEGYKSIAVQFDGVMHEADVYINGKHLFKHLGGYLPFCINISDNIKIGQNCIVLKVNNDDNPVIPPGKPISELDFNYYGGIYRNAWLIIQDKLHISSAISANRQGGGGILIHDENISEKKVRVSVSTDVKNDSNEIQHGYLKITLMDSCGKQLITKLSSNQSIKAYGFGTFSQTLDVDSPKLWSPIHPYLYYLKVQLFREGKLTDEQTIRTGIRTIRFEPGGFFINNKRIDIVGTNRHQEYPYIGYALSDNAQYRDAWKIKNAGFNFVRCSHYPPSPAFLDACDQLGILVMDAIPGWQFFGNAEFEKNSLQNIRDMIHRDRNHPAIVLWEASLNETDMSKSYMDSANAIVHLELPFKGVYTSGWKDYAFDVFSPARQHRNAPDYFKKYNRPKPLLIAEYGDWEYYAQNAGFQQKQYEGLKSEERNSRQRRIDGQKRLLQQELNFQEAHNDDLFGTAVGDVNWLMFDYRRGYAPDLETSGIMDIFRLPKFSYYFYQSQSGPNPDAAGFGKPMIFIASYWNDEKQKAVKIFSNCQQVELLLNGESLGIQSPDTGAENMNLVHAPFTFYPSSYTPGKLTAIGYIAGRKAIILSTLTPGTAYQISLDADISGKPLTANQNDIIFIYASVKDKNGTLVSNASNRVKFSVTGGGNIIGTSTIRAEAGIATILLKANAPGKIMIKATSYGLKEGTLFLKPM